MSIKDMRTRAGVSRYALAKETGLSYQGLYLLESQGRTPKLETLQKVSTALAGPLGVTPAEVLAELTAHPQEAVA